MPQNREFIAANRRERERLARLVDSLTDAELARPISEGWTVSDALAHLAFWDWRALALLERSERETFTIPPEDDYEVDAYNAAAYRLARQLSPRQAALLAPAAAEAVDGRIEAVAEAVLDRLLGDGSPVNLLRADHRGEHVDELEKLLGR